MKKGLVTLGIATVLTGVCGAPILAQAGEIGTAASAECLYVNKEVKVKYDAKVMTMVDGETITEDATIKSAGKHTVYIVTTGKEHTIYYTIDYKKPVVKSSGKKIIVQDNCGLKTLTCKGKTQAASGKRKVIKMKKGKVKVKVTDLAGNKMTKTLRLK